jgi:hypothetical protein
MDNIVVKARTLEEGAKIVEYFKSKGVDVRGYKGSASEDTGHIFIYYGLKDGCFCNFNLAFVESTHMKIVTLEELYELDQLPRRVLVSDDKEKHFVERTLVAILPGQARYKYVCVEFDDQTDFNNGKEYSTDEWRFMKEIPDVQEMTLEQVCKELGREIKIVK